MATVTMKSPQAGSQRNLALMRFGLASAQRQAAIVKDLQARAYLAYGGDGVNDPALAGSRCRHSHGKQMLPLESAVSRFCVRTLPNSQSRIFGGPQPFATLNRTCFFAFAITVSACQCRRYLYPRPAPCWGGSHAGSSAMSLSFVIGDFQRYCACGRLEL